MPIAELVYNNAKNGNIRHEFFKLNYRYYSYILLKKDINLCSRIKLVKKLANELKYLVTIAKTTPIILKSFRNRLIINTSRPVAILLVAMFG